MPQIEMTAVIPRTHKPILPVSWTFTQEPGFISTSDNELPPPSCFLFVYWFCVFWTTCAQSLAQENSECVVDGEHRQTGRDVAPGLGLSGTLTHDTSSGSGSSCWTNMMQVTVVLTETPELN